MAPSQLLADLICRWKHIGLIGVFVILGVPVLSQNLAATPIAESASEQLLLANLDDVDQLEMTGSGGDDGMTETHMPIINPIVGRVSGERIETNALRATCRYDVVRGPPPGTPNNKLRRQTVSHRPYRADSYFASRRGHRGNPVASWNCSTCGGCVCEDIALGSFAR
jgi:hypothetical protein